MADLSDDDRKTILPSLTQLPHFEDFAASKAAEFLEFSRDQAKCGAKRGPQSRSLVSWLDDRRFGVVSYNRRITSAGRCCVKGIVAFSMARPVWTRLGLEYSALLRRPRPPKHLAPDPGYPTMFYLTNVNFG
jgi:hypothetical protein